MQNQNKIFYHILPDGNAAFFVAKGFPEGPVGWWHPALVAIKEAFDDPTSQYVQMIQRLDIKMVLPFVDLNTGMAKKFIYRNGKGETDYKAIVYTFDVVQDCTESACNDICRSLLFEFNKLFQLKLVFGGNAASYGCQPKKSLDELFLKDDVVNLVMTAYFDAINDGTFLSDDVLVRKYFAHTNNVRELINSVLEGFGPV